MNNTEDWYLIKVRKGSELSVKEALERKIVRSGLSDVVWAVLVPTRSEEVVKSARKKACADDVILKGWVIINGQLSSQLRAMIVSIPNVLGQVLRSCAEDVKSFLDANTELANAQVASAAKVEVGQIVRITAGPFAGLDATIESISSNNHMIVASTYVFKRKVRLSLNTSQVEPYN